MKRNHIIFVILLIAAVGLLWRAIYTLIEYSLNNESSSHIILIPFVTIVLIYAESHRTFLMARPAPLAGITIGLVGVGLYIFSSRSGAFGGADISLSLEAASLVLIWIGSFVACYGPAARAAAFPLLFLFFIIPLPIFLLDRVVYFLQEGSTDISYLLFKAVNLPVLRRGFLLYTPTVTIEVATECSGIRSSMALLITCLLAAHLFLRTGWKMLLFVALAVPLALVKNGIRITTLTLLSIYVDPGFLRGSLHRDGGFIFFLLALAMLAPVLLLLQRSEKPVTSSAIPIPISAKA